MSDSEMNILKGFCRFEEYSNLATPWSRDKFSYASNGFMLVRLPRVEGVPERDNAPEIGRYRASFERSPVGWYSLPSIKDTRRICRQCWGVGWGLRCPECLGEGYVELRTEYHVYDDQECKSCGGRGMAAPGGAGDLRDRSGNSLPHILCDDCAGEGKLWPHDETITIDRAQFGTRLLWILQGLFRCEIGPMDNYAPARFRFWGGDGLIMPIRQS